jgi:YfiH family protein
MATVLRASRLTEQGFLHGFSTRMGGVSAPPYATLNLASALGDEPGSVVENRRRFAREVGYAPERLFEVDQVHGRAVRVLGPDDRPELVRGEQADGLVAAAGAQVAVRTADCVPVLLADPASRAVAALHAGWKGCVAGVLAAGVEALAQRANAPRERLLAAVFPHIRVCCFEVGADVAEALAAAAPSCEVVRAGARPRVALVELVRAQLTAAGLLAAQIEDVAGCTCCEPERFYSFRRDGQASGRHLAAIVSG